MLEEFKKFAFKGNVVDMAVGVIIGGAFGSLVSSLVNDLIMPLFGFITAGMDFKSLKWVLREAVMDGTKVIKPETAITYGNFIQTILNFFIIAFSIFMIIKLMSKNPFKKELPAEPVEEIPAPPTQEELLAEIRDLLKATAAPVIEAGNSDK